MGSLAALVKRGWKDASENIRRSFFAELDVAVQNAGDHLARRAALEILQASIPITSKIALTMLDARHVLIHFKDISLLTWTGSCYHQSALDSFCKGGFLLSKNFLKCEHSEVGFSDGGVLNVVLVGANN